MQTDGNALQTWNRLEKSRKIVVLNGLKAGAIGAVAMTLTVDLLAKRRVHISYPVEKKRIPSADW